MDLRLLMLMFHITMNGHHVVMLKPIFLRGFGLAAIRRFMENNTAKMDLKLFFKPEKIGVVGQTELGVMVSLIVLHMATSQCSSKSPNQ